MMAITTSSSTSVNPAGRRASVDRFDSRQQNAM
jgi:hypothetical protein